MGLVSLFRRDLRVVLPNVPTGITDSRIQHNAFEIHRFMGRCTQNHTDYYIRCERRDMCGGEADDWAKNASRGKHEAPVHDSGMDAEVLGSGSGGRSPKLPRSPRAHWGVAVETPINRIGWKPRGGKYRKY